MSLCLTTADYSSPLEFSYSFFAWSNSENQKINSCGWGSGKSGNPAAFAGFPSGVGKSRLWTFPRSVFFHGPFTHRFCYRAENIDGVRGTGRGRARHARELIGHKNDRVADSKFAVHDPAVRPGHAHDFRGTKNLFVEIHGAGRVFARQPGGNGMIPLRDSSDSI